MSIPGAHFKSKVLIHQGFVFHQSLDKNSANPSAQCEMEETKTEQEFWNFGPIEATLYVKLWEIFYI
jgi:hypothetical protein